MFGRVVLAGIHECKAAGPARGGYEMVVESGGDPELSGRNSERLGPEVAERDEARELDPAGSEGLEPSVVNARKRFHIGESGMREGRIVKG